ncbi:hypothetical protein ES332_D12G229900v1 [Gossypium tomentosum]|uniref:Uncharacterized protein n=1 Tax=Gossypium tomentosum TaxID=34277 RepID=A0A5D2IE32_GOSTO|nr:hypothetical protein ES332_D12G229900v1 [Gossypium tomentosum]
MKGVSWRYLQKKKLVALSASKPKRCRRQDSRLQASAFSLKMSTGQRAPKEGYLFGTYNLGLQAKPKETNSELFIIISKG